MDGGADATILELHVDDEPAPASTTKQVSWGWFATLLVPAVCAWWFTTGLDSSRQDVQTSDIASTVRSDLSGQLLGDLRVNSVRCVRRTRTDARCVAELFDKSGDGPIVQRVTVSIEPDSGDYFWHAGTAHRASLR